MSCIILRHFKCKQLDGHLVVPDLELGWVPLFSTNRACEHLVENK